MKNLLAAALVVVSVQAHASSVRAVLSQPASFVEGIAFLLTNSGQVDEICIPVFSQEHSGTYSIISQAADIRASWNFASLSVTSSATNGSLYSIGSAGLTFSMLLAPFASAAFSALAEVTGFGQATFTLWDSDYEMLDGGRITAGTHTFGASWTNNSALPALYTIGLHADSQILQDSIASHAPEPATWAMMLIGLLGVFFACRAWKAGAV